ncbi:MAG: NlpC/P60 family protein [Tissierellia bacterium]|nr:NlpC/P60 family protein [Tissierellia bacterium]
MDKKKLGTSVGIIASLAIGATAYGSAVSKLDNNDKNLADQISYESKVTSDTYRKYENLAKKSKASSKYTNDVKGTKVGGETKEKTPVKAETTIQYVPEEVEEQPVVEEEPQQEAIYVVKYVNVASLNVRSEANVYDDSNIVDILGYGDEVQGYLQDGWVVTNDGNYILADYLVDEKPEIVEEEPVEEEVVEEAIEYTGWVNVESLNARSEANEESDIVSTFTKGDKLSGVLKDGWLEVTNEDGSVFYVNASYLADEEIEKPEVEQPQEQEEQEEEVEEPQEETEEAIEYTGWVDVNALNVRTAPSTDSDIETVVTKGEKLSGILKGEWLEVNLNGKTLYVNVYCLSDTEVAPDPVVEEQPQEQEEEEVEQPQEDYGYEYTGWVTSDLNVRTGPSTDYKRLGTAYKGDKLSGIVKDGWLEFTYNGRTAYVSFDFLSDTEVAPDPVVEEEEPTYEEDNQSSDVEGQYNPGVSASGYAVASLAQQFVGYPYSWGSSDPSVGFDCSGLVYYVYQQAGITLNRSSYEQFYNGYSVDMNNLQPGDLVFFNYGGGISHVGIIVSSDGTYVHSSSPGVGVVYGNVYDSYNQSVIAGARRIF